MYPVYREKVPSSPCEYPANLCRTMAPAMYQFRRVIGHHFKLRHAGHKKALISWIAGYRKDLAACGWSANARVVNAGLATTWPARTDREFHVVVVHDKTGCITRMTSSPLSHAEGCTMLSKITDYPWRTKRLVEVIPGERVPVGWGTCACRLGSV